MANRKRLTKRQVAKRTAKKVVITARPNQRPTLIGKTKQSTIQHEDVEFMTLAKGRKINPDLFLV